MGQFARRLLARSRGRDAVSKQPNSVHGRHSLPSFVPRWLLKGLGPRRGAKFLIFAMASELGRFGHSHRHDRLFRTRHTQHT
jgi:hypothetical protein